MIYLFDVDGTLTESRRPIDYKFKPLFEEFCENNQVYIVTGSDRPKTVEQLGDIVYKVRKVYNCSGNDVWEKDKNVHRNDWKIGSIQRMFLIKCLAECEFDISAGNHIEQRQGVVNFSIPGRNATWDERTAFKQWEAKNNHRVKIVDAFNIMFPDLTAVVAGDTGIDIYPKGCDKSQILDEFDISHVMFFGDKTEKGGNDYEIAEAVKQGEGIVHEVCDWMDTWEVLKNL